MRPPARNDTHIVTSSMQRARATSSLASGEAACWPQALAEERRWALRAVQMMGSGHGECG